MKKLAIILLVVASIILLAEITYAQYVINGPTVIRENRGVYTIGQSFRCLPGQTGIRVFGDTLTIRNPHGYEITGSGGIGIESFGKAVVLDHLRIRGFDTNIFMNAENGVINGKILDCEVNDGVNGIVLSGSVNNELSRNTGSGNIHGIHVGATSHHNWGKENEVDSYQGDIGCMENNNWIYNNYVSTIPFTLHQNYPNPFNPITRIGFNLPRKMRVKVFLLNMHGQRVAILTDEIYNWGGHMLFFDARHYNLASGKYFYRIEAGEFVETKKMTLMK